MAEPHSRPMDFSGRPLIRLVYVGHGGYRSVEALLMWVKKGADFAA